MPNPSAIAQVTERERARRAALLATDLAAVDSLYDDLLVYRHASCKMDDKCSFMQSLQHTRYRSIDVKHEKVTICGATAVVDMAEKIVTRRDDVEKAHHVLALDIWSRGDGGVWRLVARQAAYDPQAQL